MVEWDFSNSRMCPGSMALYDDITAAKVIHGGQADFELHVINGVTTPAFNGWKVDKGRALESIDALVAMVMAHDAAQTNPVKSRNRKAVFL